MPTQNFPFDPFTTYYCVICNAAIEVVIKHNDDGDVWSELESMYWTIDLKPLCSAQCSHDWEHQHGGIYFDDRQAD